MGLVTFVPGEPMSQPRDQQPEIKELGDLLDSLIDVSDPRGHLSVSDLPARIDFLDRAIQVWRFHNRHDNNEVPFETFIQSQLLVDDGRIRFAVPETVDGLGSGTPATRLQPRLLMFLLLYHRDKYPIYDIIEKFIEKVRGDLTVLDFKKTQTGVTRCFTNTRFAANKLRDYGFLRYTEKEAFKTWVLSLPGLLVASRVIEKSKNWSIDDNESLRARDVHPDVLDAADGLKTFDQFVSQLQFICGPNLEVFETFSDVLKNAFRLLPGYWDALRDEKLTQAERKEETTKRLKSLHEDPRMEQFYIEFSKCVNVDQLLKDVDAKA